MLFSLRTFTQSQHWDTHRHTLLLGRDTFVELSGNRFIYVRIIILYRLPQFIHFFAINLNIKTRPSRVKKYGGGYWFLRVCVVLDFIDTMLGIDKFCRYIAGGDIKTIYWCYITLSNRLFSITIGCIRKHQGCLPSHNDSSILARAAL